MPGEGDPETEVVFVGEGPGYNEDRLGRPFVGAAGNLLNELLSAIGWRREQVFITNVVKCRPPDNRDPQPDEIAACAPYLRRQLEVLDPALVITLGRHSLQTFMPGARIGAAHGTQRPVDPTTGAPNATAYAMYHPAAALRQGTLRQTMLEDMAAVPELLIRARAGRAAVAQPVIVDGQVVDAVEQAPRGAPLASQQPAAEPQSSVPQHPSAPEHAGWPESELAAAAATPSQDPDNQMELF